MVYQGARDYPRSIGVPDELVRRIFLQGLPQWLREALALKEDEPLQSLIDSAQRIWNIRTNGNKVNSNRTNSRPYFAIIITLTPTVPAIAGGGKMYPKRPTTRSDVINVTG